MTSQYFFNVDHLEWLKTPNDQMTRHICFKSYQMTRNTKLPCDLSLLKFPAILKWPNYLKHHLERPKTPNDQMTTRFSCKCYQMTKNAKLPDDICFKSYQMTRNTKLPCDLSLLKSPAILKWPNYLKKHHLERPKTPNDQMTTRFSCKCYQMTKNAKLPDDFSFPISLEFLKWPNDLEKLNDPSIFYSQGSLWMTKNTKWPNYYTLSLQMLPNDYKYQITIWRFLFKIFIIKWLKKPNDCETPDDFRNISV